MLTNVNLCGNLVLLPKVVHEMATGGFTGDLSQIFAASDRSHGAPNPPKNRQSQTSKATDSNWQKVRCFLLLTGGL
jgi:hypothetical protein